MSSPTRRLPRLIVALLVPGAATFAAWWIFLGTDADGVYTVRQCVALGVVLIAIGVAAAWLVRPNELSPVTWSGALGISAACYLDWRDDETGLFLVGWFMITGCALLGTLLVVRGTAALKRSRSPMHLR